METITYGIKRDVKGDFEAVEKRVREALQKEGFGILTEIDVQATMRAKLGKELPAQKILGACNPGNAYKALQAEREVGLLLPCNVILYEGDGVTPGSEDGTVRVAAIKPTAAMSIVGNDELAAIAQTIEEKLARALASVEVEQ